MKKLILSLALTAAFASAWAANSAAAESATLKPALPASAAAAPAVAGDVTVTGAKPVAAAPMELTFGGKKQDPTFQVIAEVASKNPTWTVTKLVRGAEKTRVTMSGAQAKAELEMDVSTELGDQLKLKKGDVISSVSRQGAVGAMVSFNKDKTPMGFMVSPGTKVNGQ